MCELFCMSSSGPATFQVSLEPFARHGGLEGPHKDGWGIAWYVDSDVRLLKEPHPAAHSGCVRFILENPVETELVISHIRRATVGPVSIRNCQPFVRELGGRMHVFAHNGHFEDAALRDRLPLDGFAPVGETDSEYAFCGLMSRMRRLWRAGSLPRLQDRIDLVSTFAATARELGPANFIYSDGDAVFIHGDRRHQGEGRGIRPPGLHILERPARSADPAFRTAGLSIETASGNAVVVAASVPLNQDKGWRPLGSGDMVVLQRGVAIARTGPSAAAAPLQ